VDLEKRVYRRVEKLKHLLLEVCEVCVAFFHLAVFLEHHRPEVVNDEEFSIYKVYVCVRHPFALQSLKHSVKELSIVNKKLVAEDHLACLQQKAAKRVFACVYGIALAQYSLKSNIIHQLSLIARVQHLRPDGIVILVDAVEKAEVDAFYGQLGPVWLLLIKLRRQHICYFISLVNQIDWVGLVLRKTVFCDFFFVFALRQLPHFGKLLHLIKSFTFTLLIK